MLKVVCMTHGWRVFSSPEPRALCHGTFSPLSCHTCLLGKMPNLPISVSRTVARSPFDLVHSNIYGPSPSASKYGFLYYVIFVDDNTHCTWISPSASLWVTYCLWDFNSYNSHSSMFALIFRIWWCTWVSTRMHYIATLMVLWFSNHVLTLHNNMVLPNDKAGTSKRLLALYFSLLQTCQS